MGKERSVLNTCVHNIDPIAFHPKAVIMMHLAGLLTCSGFTAFPLHRGEAVALLVKLLDGTYSYGDSPGFSPDSLFNLCRTKCAANIWVIL